MYLIKIVILSLLLLSTSGAYSEEIDWQDTAADHIRLNIILFINIGIFTLILLLTFFRFNLLKKQNKHFYQDSFIDVLTSVLNRKGFHCHLDNLTNKSGFLLIADIDNFKSINDRFGHNTGDKVLKRVASTLKLQIRNTDILGRYGGEEFIIFFPDQEVELVQAVSERLVKSIAELNVQDLTPELEQITISIGVDRGSVEKEKFELLFESADSLLYQAKNSGKNKAVLGFA